MKACPARVKLTANLLSDDDGDEEDFLNELIVYVKQLEENIAVIQKMLNQYDLDDTVKV